MVLPLGLEPSSEVLQTPAITRLAQEAWYSVLESNQCLRHVKAALIPSTNRAYKIWCM